MWCCQVSILCRLFWASAWSLHLCTLVQKCTNGVIRSKLLYGTVLLVLLKVSWKLWIYKSYHNFCLLIYSQLKGNNYIFSASAFNLFKLIGMQLCVDYDCLVLLITQLSYFPLNIVLNAVLLLMRPLTLLSTNSSRSITLCLSGCCQLSSRRLYWLYLWSYFGTLK